VSLPRVRPSTDRQHGDGTTLYCLIPDLPDANALMPWLVRIDQNHWYTNGGPLVGEFEQRLGKFISGAGDAYCVTLSSGTAALELGLTALGINAGKRVLLPALTFPATALAVERCGAQPVLGDVCPDRWSLTPDIARHLAERERIDLVMPVAAFGAPLPGSDWDRFVADTHIPVLADAAGALGAQALTQRVHWAFSLHATKPLGIGEGGVFVSFDADLAQRVRRMANFGFDHRVVSAGGGTNAKLSEYAAAVGLAQLARWPQLLATRRAVFAHYCSGLAQLRHVRMQRLGDQPPATLCIELAADASMVAEQLAHAGIETRRWYMPPLYLHPGFAHLDGADVRARLPVTEHLAQTLIGLPFHTRLAAADVARVVGELSSAIERLRTA